MEKRDNNLFQAILKITQEINSIHKLEELLRKILDIAMTTLQADRGFIILNEKQMDQFGVPIARNLSQQDLEDLTSYSSSVVEKVLKNGESILTYDAQQDDRFKGADSIVLNRIKSIASVPLKRQDKIIGAIYVDHVGKLGFFDEKSLDFLSAFSNQAAIAIENARLISLIQQENENLKQQVFDKYLFKEMVGESPAMQQVFKLLHKIAQTDATVLIEGESGTGKELVARAVHYNGKRKEKPFITVFCSSLTETLLEDELFGHKRGAFTGANEDRKGLLESADGGTIFLDEVSEISLNTQTKLLRFLQEGEIKRLGEVKPRIVDVRVITATNKILADQVKSGKFREDLFYRLNVIKVQLPPLSERAGDVFILAQHFLEKYKNKTQQNITAFSSETITVLENYSWPGNVRELENTIERAVILANQEKIQPENLQIENVESIIQSNTTLRDFEKKLVMKTLAENNKNISKTAKVLEVSRRWLHYRLKEWGHET